jgi:multiple antibiotic resistance protein
MSDLFLGLLIFSSLFAIVDPVGMLPIFLALTEGFSDVDRRFIIRRSTIFAGILLILFALLGRYIFLLLSFTIFSFEIAGGFLLFAIAFDMLFGETSRTKYGSGDQEALLSRREEIGIVPLGMPLLAGPGAISTVMIYAQLSSGDTGATLALYVAVILVMVTSYLLLVFGGRILARAGRVGLVAISRVMGLLLAAIAVQFVINGIVGAFGLHVP